MQLKLHVGLAVVSDVGKCYIAVLVQTYDASCLHNNTSKCLRERVAALG